MSPPSLSVILQGEDRWTASSTGGREASQRRMVQGWRSKGRGPAQGQVARGQGPLPPTRLVRLLTCHPVPTCHGLASPFPAPLSGLRWLSPWQPCSFRPG